MNNKLKAGNIALMVAVGAGLLALLAIVLGVAYRPGTDTNSNTPSLGAVSGPTISGNYFSVGGVGMYSDGKRFTTATTTVCAIRSPNATSTLLDGSASFSVSSTTGTTITLAKATTPYATTTSLGAAVIAANAQGTVIATTTPLDALDEDKTFAPLTYFVVGMAGGTGTFSPTGFCHARWVIDSTTLN